METNTETSPPAIPEPPTPNVSQNPPYAGPRPVQLMSDEEILAEQNEELAAREKDLEQARKEAREGEDVVLPAPWIEIRQHIGIGPLAYETKRGLVKVNSGDFICTFEYPVLADDGITTIMERETIILKELALLALKPPPTDLPLALETRVARITEKRQTEAWEKDHPEARKAREEREKKAEESRKKLEESRKAAPAPKRPAKPDNSLPDSTPGRPNAPRPEPRR